MRTKVTDLHPNREWEWIDTGSGSINAQMGIIHLSKGTVVVCKEHHSFTRYFYTELVINHNGKVYTKKYPRRYSNRFCTTLAKRFIAEVIEMSKQGK